MQIISLVLACCVFLAAPDAALAQSPTEVYGSGDKVLALASPVPFSGQTQSHPPVDRLRVLD